MFEYVNTCMVLDVTKRYCNSNEVCAFVGLHFNNFIIMHGIENLKKMKLLIMQFPYCYMLIYITNKHPIKNKRILRILNKLC